MIRARARTVTATIMRKENGTSMPESFCHAYAAGCVLSSQTGLPQGISFSSSPRRLIPPNQHVSSGASRSLRLRPSILPPFMTASGDTIASLQPRSQFHRVTKVRSPRNKPLIHRISGDRSTRNPSWDRFQPSKLFFRPFRKAFLNPMQKWSQEEPNHRKNLQTLPISTAWDSRVTRFSSKP